MTKITLATLHQATAQEVADQIVNHLLDQNEKSATYRSNGELCSCMYRAGNIMCAAGCLIGDDEYDEKFEHKQWQKLIEHFGIPDDHCGLIADFQDVHDTYSVASWEHHLKGVLDEHGLEFNRRVSSVVAGSSPEVEV